MNHDLSAFSESEMIPAQLRTAFSTAELVVENQEVLEAIDQLAVRLTIDFHERHPIILFNLSDGVWFFTTVAQRLFFPHTTSYCDMEPEPINAEIFWKMEPIVDVQGRDVLFLVGKLSFIEEIERLNLWAQRRGALSVSIGALVDRTNESDRSKSAYSCFRPKEQRVFGCGLSYGGYGYSLPDLYSVLES